MYRKTFLKIALLFFPLLVLIPGLHLLVQAEGGQAVYLPVVARSATCFVPSTDYLTIQSAVDDECFIIHLTAALYVENVYIQDHIVTIRGQGPTLTTIDGNITGVVFQVMEDAALTLEGVTVTNGDGGIGNVGVTHLINAIVKENWADYSGGGISSSGTLTVENSWIIDNRAGADGGGVFIKGTAYIANTTISGNVANGVGGGISVGEFLFGGAAQVTIANSEISDNEAEWGGGVSLGSGGTVLISNSLISENETDEGGGGIFNAADMEIVGSRIVGNTSFADPISTESCGGGIMNAGDPDSTFWNGVLLVDRTEIRDNVSYYKGGGICNDTPNGGTGSGEVEVFNSLFVGNSVIGTYFTGNGGGFYSDSENLDIVENSTFVDNTVNFIGGAVAGSYLRLVNVTVTKNDAPEGGGGVFSTGEIQMVNTIVFGNLSGGDCAYGTSSVLTSLGHNIDGDGSCDLDGPGDMPDTNPLLGPLQYNGGPTHTTAIPSNSPAKDSADNAACPPTDQRGVIRPQGAGCDIGAYEYNG